MNKHKSDLDSYKHYQLPVDLLAQLEEPCRGHGFNSCTGLIFFPALFSLCSVHYCKDHSHFHLLMTFIYSQPFICHLTGLLQTNKMTSSQLAY